MREILEEVRRRILKQLTASPDTESWDEASKDRLLLVQEATRYLRLNIAPVRSNGIAKPVPSEYTGEICQFCGSPSMRRAGACSVCENCGTSGGCS